MTHLTFALRRFAAGSLFLAASYPLTELTFRLSRGPIPEESAAFHGALINVVLFSTWTVCYTVPRWHLLVVEPMYAPDVRAPSVPWAVGAYALHAMLVGVHALAVSCTVASTLGLRTRCNVELLRWIEPSRGQFFKAVRRLGTVPIAVSKGAQRACPAAYPCFGRRASHVWSGWTHHMRMRLKSAQRVASLAEAGNFVCAHAFFCHVECARGPEPTPPASNASLAMTGGGRDPPMAARTSASGTGAPPRTSGEAGCTRGVVGRSRLRSSCAASVASSTCSASRTLLPRMCPRRPLRQQPARRRTMAARATMMPRAPRTRVHLRLARRGTAHLRSYDLERSRVESMVTSVKQCGTAVVKTRTCIYFTLSIPLHMTTVTSRRSRGKVLFRTFFSLNQSRAATSVALLRVGALRRRSPHRSQRVFYATCSQICKM
jgi:hypothetical protein